MVTVTAWVPSLAVRKQTRSIEVGGVTLGGEAPIAVQSMTNTKTEDLLATRQQIERLVAVGADLVRVSVPNKQAVEAFGVLAREAKVPLIADIHFDYRLAIQSIQAGASCVRVNPGNHGPQERLHRVVDACKAYGAALRIGVNAGSLEPDLLRKYGSPTPAALVASALRQVAYLDEQNFFQFKLSVKSSDVPTMLQAYRELSRHTEQPLHVGVTEAGTRRVGTVKNTLGVGLLLSEGIGDTLRISLTDDPEEEIRVGLEILKSLHLRRHGITFTSCPTCSRTEFDVLGVVQALEERFANVTTPLVVSIIGCCVNGVGEAHQADLGVVGYRRASTWYLHGVKQSSQIENDVLFEHLSERIAALLQQMGWKGA